MISKIILSPSKTQQTEPINFKVAQAIAKPRFYHESLELLKQIQLFSKEELGKRLQVAGKVLDEAYAYYHPKEQHPVNHAIGLYTGLVFKGLQLETYNAEALAYMKEHVRILSAFYGLLSPFDEVHAYRLDMKSKVFEKGSYRFWEERIHQCFSNEDVIVNLASDEFSKLIKHPMINVHFKTKNANDEWIVKSTPAKMARGQMAHFMIHNSIKDIKDLKEFEWNGYRYSKMQSDEYTFVFAG